MPERVVVVDTGAFSSLGNSDEIRQKTQNGQLGISEFTPQLWEEILEQELGPNSLLEGYTPPIQAISRIPNFDPTDYMDKRDAKRNDRATHIVAAAASEIINTPDLQAQVSEHPERHGVQIGLGFIGFERFLLAYEKYKKFAQFEERETDDGLARILKQIPEGRDPFMISAVMANKPSSYIAKVLGRMGPNLPISTACATGTDNIGSSFRSIRDGYADTMVTGGGEGTRNSVVIMHFDAIHALSHRPYYTASTPFDKDRDGFVFGEAAGLLLLSSLPFAVKHNLPIRAEVLGYASINDAYHDTDPSVDGQCLAIRTALADARLAPDEIEHINAHGTSTPKNDENESKAIENAFGPYATKIPVTSTKSMTGHLLGAAGGIESIISVQTIEDGIIPPTINVTTVDPKLNLDYVINTARRQPVRTVLSESFGFGGCNGVIIYGPAPE